MSVTMVTHLTDDFLKLKDIRRRINWHAGSFSQYQRGQLHNVGRHCEVCGKPLPAHNGGKSNRCCEHRDPWCFRRSNVVKLPEGYIYRDGFLVPDWWEPDFSKKTAVVLYRGKGLTGIFLEILAMPKQERNPFSVRALRTRRGREEAARLISVNRS